ncbi:hypothetical protein SPRG_05366 [Saprolegnia parasitica CBS 223.65]|uniref:Uncharacterized protein n=1 Tax=Saprolegnia parasitica (strain CBS 223.65) TaxID=695850 RepID=A0A067CHJ6_SAPPC|nr:hypothetical protein SPRG_05366 [Saprolegnia parasitica CBS 223.65]KDO30174.1 hypothetical protein SPRG_05366 [Saprolegnia parasitica CBS 223.65]|eukprot:XP_012199352.1 hypothetical protein SPRG_05366 [Saprolegnia parasitica CBS 223.65]
MCSTLAGPVVAGGHFAISSTAHEDSKLSDTLPLDDEDDDLPDFPDATSSSSSSSDEPPIEDRLLKPMPVLAVCPMADAHTMLLDKPSMLGAVQINMPPLPLNMHSPPPQNMILKRDPLAIRQQYWSQLGINLSVRDLERSTGRRRINREGIKVKLNDVNIKPKSKSFFKAFSRWVRNDSRDSDISEAAVEEAIATAESPMSSSSSSDSETEATPPKESSIWMLQQGRLTPPRTSPLDAPTEKKQIKFNEEAVMYHIPLHRELSRRQRDAMWYTREEFISMVERNLDEMYDEMEREYEEQVKMEATENDMMAAEEAYQRRVAVELQKQTETMLQQQLRAAALLQQQAQLVKVAPRGSKEIRFKYLKHLGIHNN